MRGESLQLAESQSLQYMHWLMVHCDLYTFTLLSRNDMERGFLRIEGGGVVLVRRSRRPPAELEWMGEDRLECLGAPTMHWRILRHYVRRCILKQLRGHTEVTGIG